MHYNKMCHKTEREEQKTTKQATFNKMTVKRLYLWIVTLNINELDS